jgi:hypothetical protein
MGIVSLVAKLFPVKVKVVAMQRCAVCDLPLGLHGMGPTLESRRGAVHTLCVPTWVRDLGEEAVQAFLKAETFLPIYEAPAPSKVVGAIYGPVAPRA